MFNYIENDIACSFKPIRDFPLCTFVSKRIQPITILLTGDCRINTDEDFIRIGVRYVGGRCGADGDIRYERMDKIMNMLNRSIEYDGFYIW